MEHVVEVRDDPVVGDAPARRLDQALERESIGVEDLSRLARVAGLGHLVTRGQHRHPRALAHEELRQPQRGGHAQLLRPQHRPRGQDDAARAHVLAAAARVDSGLDEGDQHAAAPPLDHLLRIYGVGPGGHGRAGHDA